MSRPAPSLRLGTRRSPLALAQSTAVAAAVTARTGRLVELVEVTTAGDVSNAALTTIGGTGVFVTALRDALRRGEVDVAVHSLKDLPTAAADDLVVAAVPAREDPRDALACPAGMVLGELAPGSRIGTGSPRRAAQLHALALGFDVVPIRGNVDTRLRKAAAGEVDAVVLAYAGLARLGRLDAVTEVLEDAVMLPAPGQGALAVECRADRADLRAALADLDDARARVTVDAERSLLGALQAGCTAPVGALADVVDRPTTEREIALRAVVAAPDGSAVLRRSIRGPAGAAAALGRRLAGELLAAGAADLMQAGA